MGLKCTAIKLLLIWIYYRSIHLAVNMYTCLYAVCCVSKMYSYMSIKMAIYVYTASTIWQDALAWLSHIYLYWLLEHTNSFLFMYALNVTCIFQTSHILPHSQLWLHLVSVLHVLHQDLQSLALFAQKVEDPGKAIGTERGGQTLEGLEELNIAAPFPCFLQRREEEE